MNFREEQGHRRMGAWRGHCPQSIRGISWFVKIDAETNLLQLFAHPETSEWLSIIYVISLEVNIVTEQKQAW